MDTSRTLLLATTNAGKLREFRELLAGLPFDVRPLAEIPAPDAPEETGQTFADNARLKALHYASAAGLLTVAEDSGLEIDALGGAPGVHSARLGGVDLPYPAKFELIYERLRQVGAIESPARFVCALALVDNGHVVFEARETVEGRIAPEPRGTGGFGYDPIFFHPPLGCTLAEAGDRKAAVSHRGQAVRKLREFLERRGREGEEGREG